MFSVISSLIAIVISVICFIAAIITMDDDRCDAFKAMLWCISEHLHGRKV